MKEKFFVLFLFIVSLCFSQQKKFKIEWEGNKRLSTGTFSVKTPYFNSENFSFSFDDGLQYVAQWRIENNIDQESVQISNVVYSIISKDDLGDLDISTIPNGIKYSLETSIERNHKYAFLQISPIIKNDNGSYSRVLSFQIKYNEGGGNKKLFGKIKSSKSIYNSVLQNGSWYKFYIDTTGVFKLSKGFLERLGVNVNSIDPRTIKIYGNGGGMIPYSNAEEQAFDVTENAIKVFGEEDGVFNNSDYIAFYGEGPKGYSVESNTNINCYTDKTYYYINVGGSLGKRIQPMIEPVGNVDLVIDDFEDYKFYEKDIHNLGTLGRRWFGDRFDIENERTYEFEFPNLITSVPVELKVHVAAASTQVSSFSVDVDNTNVSTMSLGVSSERNVGASSSFSGNINVGGDKVTVKLNYDNQGNPAALGYLDYVSIKATRELKFEGSQFQFEKSEVFSLAGIGQYNISNATEVSEVWEVTDKFNITSVVNTDSNSNLSFKSLLGTERSFVALADGDYLSPKVDANTSVRNQNIKGTVFVNDDGDFQDVDYIIISPNNMLSQAERLAQINRKQYDLNVKVYGLDDIYAEFSTGNQDIGAIRNLVKYVYDNASEPDKRIKYLCLFGDTSYDYKDRIPNNTNIVPSWYSYNSFSYTNSYVSDDFYGMMDDTEGAMHNGDRLDIAVGRIIAGTPQQGKEMVDKIESYYIKEAFGSWRNNFVVVSDDVDKDWEGILQETTDNIGNLVTQNKPFINVVKIHTDAFQQQSSAGGDQYPKVNEAFLNAMNNGALVVNYFGHGGEDGLSSERIFFKKDVENLRNFCKLNCFVTVTCEFTKFDNPFRQTAGEFTYWNKEAGAIGLITTTRQVFVDFGINFNNALGQYLFSYNQDDTYADDEYPSMAEALRLTKISPSISGSSQRRLVFFIGDPAMKLAFSKPNVKLTKLNDVPIAQATDTLKALSRVKLSGEVTDSSGSLLSNYTGVLSTTIYDKFIERQTLANDGTRLNGEIVRLNFSTLGEIIFRGQASVENGVFEFDFVVPKDISIPVGFGKVSFYSKNEELLLDRGGAEVNVIKIGGVNENAVEDNTAPLITLYMNDENFVSGGITNESPTLLVKLEDENGINTASGIGHDIVAIIDGEETNPYVLNDYYQTEVDDYQKGVVSFPFTDLEPGLHTLSLKAWDVYNNSSIAEIQFIVFDKDQDLVINNVLNYPNPFVNYTEFWFNHNSSAPLDVSIQIFTVSGKLVRTLNGQTSGGVKATSSLSRDIIWDGRDDFGDKIGKGVYIYKLTVRSSLLNKKVEKIEKLVIL